MNSSRTIVPLSRESNGDRATAAEPAVCRSPIPRSGHPVAPGLAPRRGPAAPSARQAALVGVGLTVTMR